jgi:protein gp37
MKTKIEWTNETCNPIKVIQNFGTPEAVIGGHWCRKISEGCLHCYAETLNNAGRWNWESGLKFTGDPPPLYLDRSMLDSWARVKKSKRMFPFDMTDWCGDWISPSWRLEILDAMAAAPKITFQTLTKRPEILKKTVDAWLRSRQQHSLPKNIWLGCTIENQKRAIERIPHFLNTTGQRWLSIEPLLGPIDFDEVRIENGGLFHAFDSFVLWAVIGGESGPNARTMERQWVKDIFDQCQKWKVPIFFKQWGSNSPYNLGGKGGDFADPNFPEWSKIREFPEGM